VVNFLLGNTARYSGVRQVAAAFPFSWRTIFIASAFSLITCALFDSSQADLYSKCLEIKLLRTLLRHGDLPSLVFSIACALFLSPRGVWGVTRNPARVSGPSERSKLMEGSCLVETGSIFLAALRGSLFRAIQMSGELFVVRLLLAALPRITFRSFAFSLHSPNNKH